jgi:hypothetical protein
MILCLPIDGTLVCGPVSSVGWSDSVGEAISIRPPDVPMDQNDKKTMGMHSRWLTSTPAQRVLRMQSFRGMTGLVFGIWMTSDCF